MLLNNCVSTVSQNYDGLFILDVICRECPDSDTKIKDLVLWTFVGIDCRNCICIYNLLTTLKLKGK